jgi:hypothetical protein
MPFDLKNDLSLQMDVISSTALDPISILSIDLEEVKHKIFLSYYKCIGF